MYGISRGSPVQDLLSSSIEPGQPVSIVVELMLAITLLFREAVGRHSFDYTQAKLDVTLETAVGSDTGRSSQLERISCMYEVVYLGMQPPNKETLGVYCRFRSAKILYTRIFQEEEAWKC